MLVAWEVPSAVKWWDEEGAIHYSDAPPPSGWTRIEVLNDQGIVIKVITPKPPEPAKKEEKPPEDIPLWLKSFGSEEALIRLRDKRLDAIDRQIAVARAIIRQLESQKEALEAQGDEKEALETQRQIEEQEAFIRRMEREKRRILDQFRAYVACYRALKANRSEECSTWNIRGREGSPPPRR